MIFNVEKWKEFVVGRILKCETTSLSIKADLDDGDIPFISRTAENNGCDGYVSVQQIALSKGNCLTIGAEGIYSFYQLNDFATGNKIYTLRNDNLNIYHYMFLSTILNMEDYRYNYGRARIKSKLEQETIQLPVLENSDGTFHIDEKKTYSDEGYVPDWQYMEEYIKALKCKPPTTKNIRNEMSDIKTGDWQEFRVGNLISKIYKAKALNKEDLLISDEKSSSIRYITRTSEDNGCEFRAALSEINPSFIEKGNAISIGDTTATCFYQSEQFITGDHMVVVRADWLNEINALFIVAILNKEQYKYSYGRAFLMDRIKDTVIKLPVRKNADGTAVIDSTHKYSENGYIPDWKFMESYIKNLPYGDRI